MASAVGKDWLRTYNTNSMGSELEDAGWLYKKTNNWP